MKVIEMALWWRILPKTSRTGRPEKRILYRETRERNIFRVAENEYGGEMFIRAGKIYGTTTQFRYGEFRAYAVPIFLRRPFYTASPIPNEFIPRRFVM